MDLGKMTSFVTGGNVNHLDSNSKLQKISNYQDIQNRLYVFKEVSSRYTFYYTSLYHNFYQKIFIAFFTVVLISAYSTDIYAQTCSGFADQVVSSNGVFNSDNAVGSDDNIYAELYDNGDQIVLDLTNVINQGQTYTIRWARDPNTNSLPSTSLEESLDNVTWTTASGSPFSVNNTDFFDQNIVANVHTRYLRFTSLNQFNLDLDALSYTNVECGGCEVTITQSDESSCLNNNTKTDPSDDFIQITFNATTTGSSSQYEVALNANADGTGGTLLNTGGTNFSTAVTLGSNSSPPFVADGSSTYSITVREEGNPTCHADYTSTTVASCSACSITPIVGASTLTKN